MASAMHPSARPTPSSLEMTVDRAVDLPRSQGASPRHSRAYVEDEQRGERGKDQARRGHFK